MRKSLVLFVFSMAVMFFGATPTYASTDLLCDCNPKGDSTTGIAEAFQCSCSSDHTLGILQTKKFRNDCTNANAVAKRTEICVTGRAKKTNCGQGSDAADPYDQKISCTNWSLSWTDTVTVTTYCNADNWTVIWHCSD